MFDVRVIHPFGVVAVEGSLKCEASGVSIDMMQVRIRYSIVTMKGSHLKHNPPRAGINTVGMTRGYNSTSNPEEIIE